MRKILILIGLFCALVVSGQGAMMGSIGASAAATTGVDSANWEAEYKTYYYAIAEASRPGIDTADKQNDFFEYLFTTTTYGDSIDAAWMLAQKNSVGALINIMNPGTNDATDGNTTLHTPYEGFTGDSTDSDYINLNWNATDDASLWTLNSASIIIYRRVADDLQAAVSTEYTIGTAWTGSDYMAVGWYNSLGVRAGVNSGGFSFPSGNGIGVHAAVRRDASNLIHHLNGTEQSTAKASGGLVQTRDAYLLANNGGAAAGFSNDQISLVIFANGLSETAIEGITTAFEVLMDYTGKGIL